MHRSVIVKASSNRDPDVGKVITVQCHGCDGDRLFAVTVGMDVTPEMYRKAGGNGAGEFFGIYYYENGVVKPPVLVSKQVWEKHRADAGDFPSRRSMPKAATADVEAERNPITPETARHSRAGTIIGSGIAITGCVWVVEWMLRVAGIALPIGQFVSLTIISMAVAMGVVSVRSGANKSRSAQRAGAAMVALAFVGLLCLGGCDARRAARAHTLASACFDRKDFACAASEWGRAVELDPDDAKYRYDHGLALAQLRRYDHAAIEFREALRIQPSHEAASVMLSRVQAVLRH